MAKKTIKLIAIDLDGTLLNSAHQLSEKTINTLRRLSSAGVIICIATGRSTESIRRYLEVLQLHDQKVIPCVSYNGAVGMIIEQTSTSHSVEKTEKLVYHSPVSYDMTTKLIDFAQNYDWVTQIYDSASDTVYAVPKNDEHRHLLGKYASLVGKSQELISNYNDVINKFDSTKVLIMTNETEKVLEEASKIFSTGDIHMIRGSPDPYFVEFLRPDVCKGNGVKAVCEYLGIALEDIAAFGDGDNDREMLELAGIGVAMKNAKDAAKAGADIVMEWSNDEDGVACQLDKFQADGLFTMA